MLGSEDWSTDIEQTRDSIEREFADAKNRWLNAVYRTSETNRINAKKVIESIKKLLESHNGTFYWKLGRHDGKIWAIVLGWSSGYDENEDFVDDGYGICIKLAYQPSNSMTQYDYDVDWIMPYDKQNGVDDTSMLLNPSYLKESVMQRLLDVLVDHYNKNYN